MGYLAPHLHLIREAILGKLTRRDWDSMNCFWPFYIELWLVVEVTGTFPKGGVRATGHKTPGESSVNITVSSYDTTHLQENPQRLG